MLRRILLLAAMIMTPLLSAGPALAKTKLAQPSITSVSGTTVHWSSVSGTNFYRVRWIAPDGAKKTKKAASTATQYTINPKQLTAGVKYLVQVRAIGDKTNTKSSKWSSSWSFTAQVPLKFPALNPVAFSHDELDKIGVLWYETDGATAYRIRWFKPNGKTKGKTVPPTGQKVQTYTLERSQLIDGDGTKYTVQVRAIGDGVNFVKKGAWNDALAQD